ncbi:MAG: pyridoxamine 5'-phosphate oxidase family protein [Pseudomonadota bacterium]|nr:pyridoxamine 5'-phosphate oxidase family protein [Pseudomonadota bacterium]
MFGKEQAPEVELKKLFWEELSGSPFMMLGLEGVEDSRTRPMTAQVDVPEDGDKEDGGPIYFFASKSENLVQALGQSHRAVATYASKGHDLFAHIHGTLELSTDRATIDRLWNPIIASWYKDGRDDPDLALIRFDTDCANLWKAETGATLKAAAMKALFDVDPGKQQQKDNRADVRL